MKKIQGSKGDSGKTKRPVKDASNNGLQTKQPLQPATSELAFDEKVTIPSRKRISPAADEEME